MLQIVGKLERRGAGLNEEGKDEQAPHRGEIRRYNGAGEEQKGVIDDSLGHTPLAAARRLLKRTERISLKKKRIKRTRIDVIIERITMSEWERVSRLPHMRLRAPAFRTCQGRLQGGEGVGSFHDHHPGRASFP